jgi:hypothetical protein
VQVGDVDRLVLDRQLRSPLLTTHRIGRGADGPAGLTRGAVDANTLRCTAENPATM